MFRSHRIRPASFRLLLLLLALAGIALSGDGQSLPEPSREQLLNRLNVLLIQRSGDPNVFLKLRVHSGAAFDLAGKGGTMALLGDIFFPDPSTREYVAEELGGRLEVTTDYDAIDITISGKASEFERLVEFLRAALVTTQVSPENVTAARDARIKQMKTMPRTAARIADEAVAARLFGRFPYGHPTGGSLETITRIDRADLLLARERFLNPNISTLVVIGGIEKSRAMRALRQLLGQWRMGDFIVPATFRPPDAPDARILIINQSNAPSAEVRLAVRGLARSDRDYAGARLLTLIARDRWRSATAETSGGFVRHETHVLPGMFLFGASAPSAATAKVLSAGRDLMAALVNTPPSQTEIERARAEVLADLGRSSSQPESIADAWLDHESYKLASFSDQVNAVRNVSPADVQRVSIRLFKSANLASVVVGNSEQLKASLGSNIELPPPAVPVSVTPPTKP